MLKVCAPTACLVNNPETLPSVLVWQQLKDSSQLEPDHPRNGQFRGTDHSQSWGQVPVFAGQPTLRQCTPFSPVRGSPSLIAQGQSQALSRPNSI